MSQTSSRALSSTSAHSCGSRGVMLTDVMLTAWLYLSYAIVGTMAEVGVGRPTARARARALVLESTEIISQVRALIQTNL